MKSKLIIFIVLGCLFMSCSEKKISYKNSKEIECQKNPWIPLFIRTNDCSNIIFQKDIDTNELWGKFALYAPLDTLTTEDEILKVSNRKLSRLYNLGLDEKYCEKKWINYSDSNWILYLDAREKTFYFYGKYK